MNVGRLGGARAEFGFDLHALRRIRYVGVTFRPRSVEEVREINRRMCADLWPAVEAGTLRLPIDRVFPLAEAVEALAHMKANRHFGEDRAGLLKQGRRGRAQRRMPSATSRRQM